MLSVSNPAFIVFEGFLLYTPSESSVPLNYINTSVAFTLSHRNQRMCVFLIWRMASLFLLERWYPEKIASSFLLIPHQAPPPALLLISWVRPPLSLNDFSRFLLSCHPTNPTCPIGMFSTRNCRLDFKALWWDHPWIEPSSSVQIVEQPLWVCYFFLTCSSWW